MKILIPYYCFIIPVIVLYAIFFSSMLTIGDVVKVLFCVGTIPGCEHLWFIEYILFCYLITPLLFFFFRKIENMNKCKWMLCVGVTCAVFAVVGTLSSNLEPYRVLGFIAGFIIRKVLDKFEKKEISILSFVIVAITTVLNLIKIFFMYIRPNSLSGLMEKVFNLFCNYTHLLLGISLFIIFYYLFRNAKYNKTLQLSDKYSYAFYLVHQLLILSPFNTMIISDYATISIIVTLFSIGLLTTILKCISDCIQKSIFKSA